MVFQTSSFEKIARSAATKSTDYSCSVKKKGGASAASCIREPSSNHWRFLDLAEVFELLDLSLGTEPAEELSPLVNRTLPLIPLISIAGPPLPMRAE